MKNPAKAIIYDSECPLCAAYTQAFIRLNVLLPEERISFAELHGQEFISRMDAKRQGNEIPLVDLAGGETLYGVDALLFLIGRRWPFFSRIFKTQPLYFFAKQFYAMISYNRRIILAKNFCSLEHGCAPDYHRGYRILFLVFAAAFASWITWLFGESLAANISFLSGGKMLLLCGTGWLLTMGAAALFVKRDPLSYLGHLAVLQIIGVLVLVPAILTAGYTGIAGLVFAMVSVCCSSALMLRGHIRRVRLLGLSQAWTICWFFFLQCGAAISIFSFLKK